MFKNLLANFTFGSRLQTPDLSRYAALQLRGGCTQRATPPFTQIGNLWIIMEKITINRVARGWVAP